jgi:hypothetical protein
VRYNIPENGPAGDPVNTTARTLSFCCKSAIVFTKISMRVFERAFLFSSLLNSRRATPSSKIEHLSKELPFVEPMLGLLGLRERRTLKIEFRDWRLLRKVILSEDEYTKK